MSSPLFLKTIHALLTGLGIDAAATANSEGDFYTLVISALNIDLLETTPDALTLLCFAGTLAQPTLQATTMLLSVNRFQKDDPPINVSLVDVQPARVLLWSRMSLIGASADKIDDWFVRFVEMARATQQWVDAGTPPDSDTVGAGASGKAPANAMQQALIAQRQRA